MNLLDADLTLLELEKLLEAEIKNEQKDLRIIGDLDLSYEDYKYMILKLKGLTKYKWNIEVFEQYKLSIIATWIFALRYETDKRYLYDKIKGIVDSLQQHHMRYCIETCASAFEEFGIETYGIDIYSMEGIFEVSAIHAGVPMQAQGEFYQLLEDSLNYSNIHLLEKKLFGGVSPKLQEIYRYIGNRHQKRIIYSAREIYIDCKIKKYSLGELLEKHPESSRKFIEGCYIWCDEYEDSMNQIIGVR